MIMVKTLSTMLPLGTPAPEFELIDVLSANVFSLAKNASDKATVIMFICNHCPYVKHINEQLVLLGNDYIPKGVQFIAINSNDAEQYPDDSPENMKKTAESLGFPFPYLFDETQEIAKAYHAACTPDFYIFDGDKKLVYRGQLDNSRPGNNLPVTGEDIRNALDSMLANQPITDEQKASLGCNIKWR